MEGEKCDNVDKSSILESTRLTSYWSIIASQRAVITRRGALWWFVLRSAISVHPLLKH